MNTGSIWIKAFFQNSAPWYTFKNSSCISIKKGNKERREFKREKKLNMWGRNTEQSGSQDYGWPYYHDTSKLWVIRNSIHTCQGTFPSLFRVLTRGMFIFVGVSPEQIWNNLFQMLSEISRLIIHLSLKLWMLQCNQPFLLPWSADLWPDIRVSLKS